MVKQGIYNICHFSFRIKEVILCKSTDNNERMFFRALKVLSQKPLNDLSIFLPPEILAGVAIEEMLRDGIKKEMEEDRKPEVDQKPDADPPEEEKLKEVKASIFIRPPRATRPRRPRGSLNRLQKDNLSKDISSLKSFT
jgi:hypothetical protein